MADGGGNGGTSVLAFILGGLIVVLVVVGFFMFNGGHFGQPQHTADFHVSVNAPKSH